MLLLHKCDYACYTYVVTYFEFFSVLDFKIEHIFVTRVIRYFCITKRKAKQLRLLKIVLALPNCSVFD